MNRRQAVKTTVAAGATLPIIGQNVALAQNAAPTGPLRVLTPAQFKTVEAVAEVIIPETDTPGAKKAGVTPYIDLFLADGNPVEKTTFMEGLAWFEKHVDAKAGKPYADLPADQQFAILKELAESSSSQLAPGKTFFNVAKGMTARIYWRTKDGFQELNKNGVPPAPGCYWEA